MAHVLKAAPSLKANAQPLEEGEQIFNYDILVYNDGVKAIGSSCGNLNPEHGQIGR